MEWTVCGWLWYVRNAILRKFGPNRNLFSTVVLIAFSVTLLCTIHAVLIRYKEDVGLEKLKDFGPITPLREIAKEVVPGLVGNELTRRLSSGQLQGGRWVGPNQRKKRYKNKRKKGFNQRAFAKKGGIGNRKDKLMFSWSDSKTKSKSPTSEDLAKSGAYQEDIVVGDKIEWTKEIEQERRKELRQRSLHTKHQCENDIRGRLRRHLGKVYEHLRWVTQHSLIYCPIFKAGSTTWMKNLLTLAGVKNFNTSLHAQVNSLYPTPNGRQRTETLLQKSLKFMIVRHPFERLLSAYRDKMLRELKAKDPYQQIQQQILIAYGHIGSNTTSTSSPVTDADGTPKDIKHPSFVQFLYKVRDDIKFFWKVMDGTGIDSHWMPYWYTCAPCQIQYDIIAKMETLDLDQEFIIHAANLQDKLVNTHTHASQFDGYSDTNSAAFEYFKEIPIGLLKELEQLYWPDFKLFGYTADEYFKMTKDTI